MNVNLILCCRLMKRARDDPVSRFLDLEATLGDDDEEDQEDQEDDDGASAGIPLQYSSLQSQFRWFH